MQSRHDNARLSLCKSVYAAENKYFAATNLCSRNSEILTSTPSAHTYGRPRHSYHYYYYYYGPLVQDGAHSKRAWLAR